MSNIVLKHSIIKVVRGKISPKTVYFGLLILISLLLKSFASGEVVYRIKVEGTIDLGLAHYLARAIHEANEHHSKGILLEINTFGGRVDAATQIRDAIYTSHVPVVAFVNSRAWSAGALIALACPHIVMTEGSSLGAAEPIPSTAKTISALEGEFRSEAERYHRNSDIAGGMVNPNVEISGLKNKGEILTLTAQKAVEKNMADKIVGSEQEILSIYHWENRAIVDVPLTKSERFTRFITSPDVSTILLTLGILGIQVEIVTQHAIAGVLGLGALGLFFGGHLIANLSDFWFLMLFLVGALLLLFELHVFPGHGVSGILGVLAILASFFLALGANAAALREVAISLAIATAVFILMLRYLPKAPLFRKLILQSSPIVSSVELRNFPDDFGLLIGKTGITLSELRPSGIIVIDNKRYSAMTEGNYLPANTTVNVTGVQGSSLVVKQTNS